MKRLSAIRKILVMAALAAALSLMFSKGFCGQRISVTHAVVSQCSGIVIVAEKGSDGQETHG